MKYGLIFLIFMLLCIRSEETFVKEPTPKDLLLIERIEQNSPTPKILTLILSLSTKSLQVEYLKKNARKALRENSPHFLESNSLLMKTALEANAFDHLGDSHWNKAEFHTQQHNYKKAYQHYQKAFEIFKQAEHNYYAGRMLFNMAFLKGHFKDLTKAKVLTLSAIKHFNKEKQIRSLILAYNRISNLNGELEEYDEALEYNRKALALLDEHPQPKRYYRQGVLNNMGLTYQLKKQYPKALDHFNQALKIDPNLQNRHLSLYAQIIGNIAYTEFKNKSDKEVVYKMQQVIHIQDSIKYFPGMIFNRSRLAEILFDQGDTLAAIPLVNKAKAFAKKTQNITEYLNSLKLLSEIDVKNMITHLQQHVFLNDSLQRVERNVREAFTRLDFEAQEEKELNKQLTERSKRYGIYIIIVLFVLIVSVVGYSFRMKKQQLKFKNEKQIINEEIFLMIQQQQEKFEEGVYQERERISEELHDGVLSQLFGTRLSMGYLKTTQKKEYDQYLNDLQNIEKEIRSMSHNLKNDLTFNSASSSIFKNLIEQKCALAKIIANVTIDSSINWNNLDEKVKLNLFRILQEAMHNILKYSKAHTVYLIIKETQGEMMVIIKDDGIGFDATKQHKGIGLKNIESRVKSLNGSFNLKTAPNQGTTLRINLKTK